MARVEITDFPVEPGREVRARPKDAMQGTTVLVVTQGGRGEWFIEAASVKPDGFQHHRTVFQASTRAAIAAWFAGNRWNPGGPIGRPTV